MKRETIAWLKAASAGLKSYDEEWAAKNILVELKRLRRIERAARKTLRMHTCEGIDVALGELADALKKGGRK